MISPLNLMLNGAHKGFKSRRKGSLVSFSPFSRAGFFVWKFDGDKLSELADFFFLVYIILRVTRNC